MQSVTCQQLQNSANDKTQSGLNSNERLICSPRTVTVTVTGRQRVRALLGCRAACTFSQGRLQVFSLLHATTLQLSSLGISLRNGASAQRTWKASAVPFSHTPIPSVAPAPRAGMISLFPPADKLLSSSAALTKESGARSSCLLVKTLTVPPNLTVKEEACWQFDMTGHLTAAACLQRPMPALALLAEGPARQVR